MTLDTPLGLAYFWVLTGSPLMNQLRLAGGLLCQAVQVAVMPSPGSYCSLTPVIRG